MRWISSSLKRKLSVFLLLAVLIPLLALGLFAYHMAATATEEKAKQSGTGILRQMATNMEFIVQDAENLSLFLIGQKDVQHFLSGSGTDPVQQTKMIEFLSNLVYSKPYISDITIYPVHSSPPISNTTIFYTDLPGVDERITHFQSETKFWTGNYETDTATGTNHVISLVRPIRSLTNYKQLGTIVISLNERALTRILNEASISENGEVSLTNSEGMILARAGQVPYQDGKLSDQLTDAQLENAAGWLYDGTGEDKRTVLYDTVTGVDWTLTGTMPMEDFRNENSYVLKLMVAVIGVSMLIASVLVLYFVQRITNPLMMLTSFLKSSNPEDSLQTYPVESMDEVGQLVRSYNQLSDRIVHLTEQVKHEESSKKEADMQALQAQINPHFLYNTLSSIHWMALMNRDDKIADMVGSLSDFLRFSLNKGEEFCSVEQEVAHAKHYANIQSIRFPGKFWIKLEIDPELNAERMLKLLLQPLIENALIHGIQQQPEAGEIKVTAKRAAGRMLFGVEDNGVGMKSDKLADIKRELQGPEDQKRDWEQLERGSYGLRNVHKRLQLHYGIESGLCIESAYQEGTKVSFAIPLARKEEAESE
ncbi:cache domain-containing sensor histidine kinase [Paenibacillus paeoniae]|uniref:Sensor histidine kinase n=1 Tax=Paenibacillus paeoniae TaxID=2292705 RepID=A0A371P7M3_9BACL|nr:sensor histidine kinase [Paenibacillus paeoniae]REK71520.1 sensor histidine kinase [Paenibacillus paeoniae]